MCYLASHIQGIKRSRVHSTKQATHRVIYGPYVVVVNLGDEHRVLHSIHPFSTIIFGISFNSLVNIFLVARSTFSDATLQSLALYHPLFLCHPLPLSYSSFESYYPESCSSNAKAPGAGIRRMRIERIMEEEDGWEAESSEEGFG
ncbi:hypothetical protein K503DRAFT_775821 [Rhizopogon vinicolor AM-OR11-026]|uniref:Uncharacterized protein n=1 Tax=Rhizopogon vinicolor AM-OR11-026 TaxID=1314800 RepID=A0A1B7MKV8_9AGAM|nr:hypothetical protein K503DRAFT_775821 [Rhizopogon vinicolor AM-OR11-026]